MECLFIEYPKESKGFKLMNIRTKQIFIEISVCFEEPLQEVELVEEKYAESPSCFADHLDDENGSEGSDISYLISVIKIYQFKYNIIMSPLISQLVPKIHSLSSGETLEILLIQEAPGLIFKEQVFLSLVMIHCCSIPVI